MVADRFAGLADHVWTYRYYRGPAGVEFSLYDQIWTSPDPADAVTGCWVMCRTQITGGATDHDPAIVERDL